MPPGMPQRPRFRHRRQAAFLNQPAEVPELRSQLQSYLQIGTALPQLVLRFGHGPALPHSLRRPVSDVLV